MEQLFVYETQGTVMDAFLRHYLTMKLSSIPKQGEVYEEFKLHHLNCECAISEVWTCFRFERICFRERAQNLTSIRRYRVDGEKRKIKESRGRKIWQDSPPSFLEVRRKS